MPAKKIEIDARDQRSVGTPPDELPAGLPQCQQCRHVVFEAPAALNLWHVMYCGKWRESVMPFRPQAACWWERYDGIGRCGSVARYFERA
jgi:hypothetical protein